VVLSEELSILESCCFRPVMRNSVLEELSVRRFANIRRKSVSERSGGERYLMQSCKDRTRKKFSIICVKVVVKRK